MTSCRVPIHPGHVRAPDLVVTKDSRHPLEVIAAIVSTGCGISVARMTAHTREQAIYLPRAIGMYLAYQYTSFSATEIAHYWGMKQHGTVTYAKKVINNRLDTDRDFAAMMKPLIAQVQAQVPPISLLLKHLKNL